MVTQPEYRFTAYHRKKPWLRRAGASSASHGDIENATLNQALEGLRGLAKEEQARATPA